MTILRRMFAILLSFFFLLGTTPQDASAQEQYAPLSDGELDALVAPVALYPDALLAQVLGAATYPDQVVEADTFLKTNPALQGDELASAVAAQGWDPAVQALTQFPSVLENLAKNITWTSALGDASATQQQGVMAAVQRMRAQAKAAGNLKSGEQIKVVQESPQVIVIQPANPQIVYVPTYNPTVVYGTTVVTPGYSTSDVVAASIISFSVGVAVGAAISGGSCGWGYWGWGMSWGSANIYCGSRIYYGNPYWWGGYYPGYYPGYRPPYYPPPRPPYRPPPGYRPPYPGKPVHPIEPAPGRPNPGRPTPLPSHGGPSILPVQPKPGNPSTLPGRPGNPTTLPVGPTPNPGGPTKLPSTRPATPTTKPAPGAPSTLPAPSKEFRGYPQTPAPKQAPAQQRPNAFSGSAGGRQQSARGNRSMSGAPALPAGGGARRR
jgi:hypothetical protein